MDLAQYFKTISLECNALKKRVRCFIDENHWPTDGEFKETVLRQIISRSCPNNVSIGRGFVINGTTCSRQIDVLIYDNTQPIFYKDGELVFIPPTACKAIIEVKSKYTAEKYREAVATVSENAMFIRSKCPNINLFVGIFFYEMDENSSRIALPSLKEITLSNNNKIINHVCLGDKKFIKFWNFNPTSRINNYNCWHLYSMPELTIGYFLHNLFLHLSSNLLDQNTNDWFPQNSKENYIERTLYLEE